MYTISCVVLFCLSVVLCCLAFLSKYLMDESCIRILGLVFGVFTGLIIYQALLLYTKLNLPVYLLCDALVEVL